MARLVTLWVSTIMVLSFAQLARSRREEAEANARKLAEQVTELQRYHQTESRQRFLQAVLNELPTGVVIVVGAEMRLAMANTALQEMFQCEWPIGETIPEFFERCGIEVFAADGRRLPLENMATSRTIQTSNPLHSEEQMEEVMRWPSGRTLSVLVSVRLLDVATESGEPQLALTIQDISAIKAAERAKDEFIAIVMHELQTPMTTLKGFAQLLLRPAKRRAATALEPWQQKALVEIRNSIDRLQQLTADLMDVSRLTHGRLQLRPDHYDLMATVRRVMERLQATTLRHELRLESEVAALPMWMDEQRIDQVLHNLIGNAMKYSPEGGPITVTISEVAAEAAVLIRVRDRGLGIPAEQQGMLFGRFARAANVVAIGISGTGLGLFLCRELVERHGGRIWLESTLGEGSTFFVQLPIGIGGAVADDRPVAGGAGSRE